MGISQIPKSPILSWTGNTPIYFPAPAGSFRTCGGRSGGNVFTVQPQLLSTDLRRGKNTLKYFSKELSSDIKKEVEEYLNSLHCKIEEHLLTPADYYPTKEGSYSVRLRIIESGVSIVDLSINVPNLAAAQSVCESWPYKYQNVYDKIMEELL